jgi:hypothetical protein
VHLCFCHFVGLLHLFSANAEPKTVIRWSFNPVNAVIGHGSIVETTLEFATSSDFNHLSIEIVPELQNLVTASPSEFINVQSGPTYSILLKFVIPDDSLLGSFEGTLQIRDGKQTVPDTLKITLDVTEQRISQVIIGTAGGTLMLNDGSSLRVPPNALSAATLLTMQPTDEETLPASIVDGAAFGGAISVSPSGIEFQVPATLMIPLKVPFSPSTLVPILSADEAMEVIELASQGSTDSNGVLAIGEISHLTVFFVFLPEFDQHQTQLKNDILSQINRFLNKYDGRCFADEGLIHLGSLMQVSERLFDTDIQVYINPDFLETLKAEASYVDFNVGLHIPTTHFNDLT